MCSHNQPVIPQLPRRNGERGSALVLVILIVLAVGAMAITILMMSHTDHLVSANERDSERALFASRSGLSYAFNSFRNGTLIPTTGGTAFDSFATSVAAPLNGAEFTGAVYDISTSSGKLYRIESNGRFNKGMRTTELVFQIVPEAFKYGYMAFNEAVLHNHSGLAGPTFQIESTIFSNGTVKVPQNITLDGSIVAGSTVTIETGATIEQDVFANALNHSGTILGKVKTVTAVSLLDPGASTYDRIDAQGSKYDWHNLASTPGTVIGGGTIVGGQSSYAVQDGDQFDYSIFRRDGRLILNPSINVVKYIPPPMIDYQAMKAEADKNDATYFTSMADAMNYLASQKVTETINGKTVTTIRVGTSAVPEFLYVDDDFLLSLCPTVATPAPAGCPSPDTPGSGILNADGFYLEGGIYVSGNFRFNGPSYDGTLYPAPPDYYSLRINALPHCFPVIVAYPEPATGSIAGWTPGDTPVMTGGQSDLEIKSDVAPHESFVYLEGLTYSEGQTHIHHTESVDELVRFIGAELGYKVHNCDWFQFTYDPDVRCTKFLVAGEGVPEAVSFRELR